MIHRLSVSIFKHSKSVVTYRTLCSKVPKEPVTTLEKEEETKCTISPNTVMLLERLSLVKFDTSEGVKVLENSITFANKILHIDTDGVEPLYSVLENEKLNLRPDKVTQGGCQREVLKNAALTEDDYFVAPPGNIPLHEVEADEKNIKEN